MFSPRRQSNRGSGHKARRHRLRRVLRMGGSFLVAYGMAAQLILFGFAATAAATGGWAGAAPSMAATLCLSGLAQPDRTAGDGQTAPDGTHVRLCCGMCPLQGGILAGAGAAAAILALDWQVIHRAVPIRDAPVFVFFRMSPPVRAPPAG